MRSSAASHPGDEGSTVEAIADRLRDAISTGVFNAGQRLVESEITREFGVSRGPLREAFRRLAAEGLVDLQHHRGARVRRLSRAEVTALYEVREALEGLAARLAARHVRDGTVASHSLSTLVDQMTQALNQGALSTYVQLNKEFHDELVRLADNGPLAGLVRQLQVPLFRLQFRNIVDIASLRLGQADHEAIASAVARGDEEAADVAMRIHIRRSGADTSALTDTHFEA